MHSAVCSFLHIQANMVIVVDPQWWCEHAFNQRSSSICVFTYSTSVVLQKMGSHLKGSGKSRHLSSLSFTERCPECNQRILLCNFTAIYVYRIRNDINISIRRKVKQKGEVFHVHTMKVYRGRRGIVLLIFNLHASWRPVVNITPLLLYLWERTPVPIECKAGWDLQPVRMFWRGEKSFAPARI